MSVAFVIGYGLGNGKIEIKKVMNKEDSKKALEIQEEAFKKQQEAIDAANRVSRELLGGDVIG